MTTTDRGANDTLRPASPEAAVATRDEGKSGRVARPALVLRQREFLLGRVPALAVLPELFHRRRSILQQHELILRILLGAEAIARPRVPGNEALPIHRDHLADELLRFQWIEVDHPA